MWPPKFRGAIRRSSSAKRMRPRSRDCGTASRTAVRRTLWNGPGIGPASTPSGRLVEGEVLEGLWFDRTQEYAARRRGEDFDRLKYATREVLELDPLPCWNHLTAEQEQRRDRAAALVEDIEAEAAVRRKRTGIRPFGPAAVLAQDPLRRPSHTKKSPAPAFHAASQAVRRELRDAYAWFVDAFRQAAAKLRAGDRSAAFPAGSFPPAMPFVGG
jgi:hypothetical protein